MKRSDRNNPESSCGTTNEIDFDVVIENLAIDESIDTNRKPEVVKVNLF